MSNSPTLVSVYDGRACLGFVISRGCKGYEGFTADEKSVGIFPNQRAAANAVFAATANEEGTE